MFEQLKVFGLVSGECRAKATVNAALRSHLKKPADQDSHTKNYFALNN